MRTKILLIENHAEFSKAIVKEFLSTYDVEIATSIMEAKERLVESSFDLIMSDYDLDDGKGDEFVFYFRSKGYTQPVIAISAHERGNKAIIDAGGTEICGKMQFSRINDVIARVMREQGPAIDDPA